jgi:transposase
VARETGLDRKTVRKYLSSTAPSAPPRRTSNGRPPGGPAAYCG